MTLNTINFADMAKRENDGVSWDVRRVSSPCNSSDTVTLLLEAALQFTFQTGEKG